MKRTRKEQDALLEEYEREGGTIKSFCQKNGIKEWQFYYWRKRRSQELAERKLNHRGFIEVGRISLPPILIRLPNGLEVECESEHLKTIAGLLHEIDMLNA